MCISVVRLEFNSHLVMRNSFLIPPFGKQGISKVVMCCGEVRFKLNPNYTRAHYNLGNALFSMNETEEAISHYKMAIKLKPNYTRAHYNLGYVLIQKGEMNEAVHHFRETLKLKPDFVAARNHLELALLRLQELE